MTQCRNATMLPRRYSERCVFKYKSLLSLEDIQMEYPNEDKRKQFFESVINPLISAGKINQMLALVRLKQAYVPDVIAAWVKGGAQEDIQSILTNYVKSYVDPEFKKISHEDILVLLDKGQHREVFENYRKTHNISFDTLANHCEKTTGWKIYDISHRVNTYRNKHTHYSMQAGLTVIAAKITALQKQDATANNRQKIEFLSTFQTEIAFITTNRSHNFTPKQLALLNETIIPLVLQYSDSGATLGQKYSLVDQINLLRPHTVKFMQPQDDYSKLKDIIATGLPTSESEKTYKPL